MALLSSKELQKFEQHFNLATEAVTASDLAVLDGPQNRKKKRKRNNTPELGYLEASCRHQFPTVLVITNRKQCDRSVKLLRAAYSREIGEGPSSSSSTKAKVSSEESTATGSGKRRAGGDESHSGKGWVVGFDAEFTTHKGAVALIQLSTKSLACVYQVQRIARSMPRSSPEDHEMASDDEEDANTSVVRMGLPDSLRALLEDSDVLKVGVGVIDDAHCMRRSFGTAMKGLVDVSVIAFQRGVTPGYRSLGDLACDLLKVKKPRTPGYWSNETLSKGQVSYAALDAWMGFSIARKLFKYLATKQTSAIASKLHHWLAMISSDNTSNIDESEDGDEEDGGNEEVNMRRKPLHGQAKERTKKGISRHQMLRKQQHHKRAEDGYYMNKLKGRVQMKELQATRENEFEALMSSMRRPSVLSEEF
eukprot:TRINITY_DN1957_c0_g1_i1.p1 TRINITY_DN1957_c0_g1~~TRINITY_DN1957_c0_g1_i1.p1  ORF type:complete len:420 (+),score=86.53 TRINITY_DN1957_c0_g1_i1:160-1419(+)